MRWRFLRKGDHTFRRIDQRFGDSGHDRRRIYIRRMHVTHDIFFRLFDTFFFLRTLETRRSFWTWSRGIGITPSMDVRLGSAQSSSRLVLLIAELRCISAETSTLLEAKFSAIIESTNNVELVRALF